MQAIIMTAIPPYHFGGNTVCIRQSVVAEQGMSTATDCPKERDTNKYKAGTAAAGGGGTTTRARPTW
jgi:hypothetical protein